MAKSTFILQDTEAFMRGELDNVTVADGHILLDMVLGAYVPYGCYTSPAIPMPIFDALRVSWNADTPEGTVVEAQARVMVDGNWTGWFGFGKWSPYLNREGSKALTRGPVVLTPDCLTLVSKFASKAQVRIYLYTKNEKITPEVHLLACSVHPLDVIPGGGKRPVNARLHLMPYAVHRRAPSLSPIMDLACCLAGLTNRWGADLLPEEFALAMKDYAAKPGADPHNLCFAAAAVGCWGFPAWVSWADLSMLRAEVQNGYGAVVALESTVEQQKNGVPPLRYVMLRGFTVSGTPAALLCDPWAADSDFATETSMPLDEFLVAWNNIALFMRPAKRTPTGGPFRESVWLRAVGAKAPGIYTLMRHGKPAPLPDDFCDKGGLLAWSTLDERPHATTAHRLLHFVQPEQGGFRLERTPGTFKKYTVYAFSPSGGLLVGDVTV